MFHKLLAITALAAIAAVPATVHAQGTTTTQPQDTTYSGQRAHQDSSRIHQDTAAGSVVTDKTRSDSQRIRDTTNVPRTHADSVKWRADSSKRVAPTDSTNLSAPAAQSPTPSSHKPQRR